MIQVFTARYSETGEELLAALQAYPELEGGVNWTGGRHHEPEVLNSQSRTNKLSQLVRLDLKKVPVPPYSETRPTEPGPWLPRKAFHQQGRDLTHPPKWPDFWTKRLTLEDEWRLHFFKTSQGNYKLLRSALKVPKEKKFHPWIKSHRLGWKLSYIGGAPTSVVDVGRAAMDALSLDFGAVDIGVDGRKKPFVLEVNTCPGLEGKTLEMYISNILARFEA